jgi:ABC-type transporter Mla subunit MlaD
MATEASKFQVGAFVIAATVIGIAVVIWLGASRFFEETKRYVTYFSESVQGLDPGAAVKYRGVPAGRVARIGIAPDRNLIEVIMDIDTQVAKVFEGEETLRAQLELSGITGLRYVEIDRHAGESLRESPTLSFKAPHDLIPSARSSFKAITDALQDVYDRIMKVDVGGISNDARATLQSAGDLLRDQRIDAVLTNLKSASESTARLAKNVEAMTTGVKLAPAVDNATQAAEQARALVASLSKGINGEQLGDTFDQLNRLALSTQQFVSGLQSTMDRFDRTVANLQGLTDELRSQPSLLLFGEPPAPRRPANRSSQ